MKGQFKATIETFPKLLADLEVSKSFARNEMTSKLNQGIYVFYENDIPLYVGRTGREGRFKTRIQEHSRPSSGHNTATFAFLIAKEEAGNEGVDVNKSRGVLEKEPAFKGYYSKAKERVSKMAIKFIDVTDPIAQTLFEVYAALELNTPYNEWGTH